MIADRFVALALLITGVSHVVQPVMWTTFFERLNRAGIAAVAIAMFTLPIGLMLLLSHSDWSWGRQWVFIGLGLAYTFKGTLYALVPQVAEHMIETKGSDPKNMRMAGAVMIPAAAWITYIAFV